MRNTEKLLLAFLAGILLVWQGNVFFQRLILRPIAQKRSELDSINQEILQNEQLQSILNRETGELAGRVLRSLPRKPLDAQRLYQQWLNDLAQDSGFRELRVDPEQIANRQQGAVGVVVSIQARATLDQLCLFLDRFHRADLLHEIISLSTQAETNQGDPLLRTTLIAEGLILPDATDRKKLFVETGPGRGEAWSEDPASFRDLVQQNPFARPAPPVVARQRPAPVTPQKTGPDVAKFTYLVAAVKRGEKEEAWLFDRLNNRNLVLQPGVPVSIGDIKAVVLAVEADHVTLDRDSEHWRLEIGKNLRSMQRVER